MLDNLLDLQREDKLEIRIPWLFLPLHDHIPILLEYLNDVLVAQLSDLPQVLQKIFR